MSMLIVISCDGYKGLQMVAKGVNNLDSFKALLVGLEYHTK